METIRKYQDKSIYFIIFFISTFFVFSCVQNKSQGEKGKISSQVLTDTKDSEKKYKVTFIELGSVRCIPCRQMQSVIKSIEIRYGKEVKTAFYDVWTDAGKPYGEKYGIQAIPTQVFLDETGKEYYRHEGFFPEEELVKVLQQKGVKPN
jgi:thioredoxin 1